MKNWRSMVHGLFSMFLLSSVSKVYASTLPSYVIAHKESLCVTEGHFAHDTYVLSIDGTKVLSGIDDETTKGNPLGALYGVGAVFGGSVNPHSCYKNDCLNTAQNWTV